ncbi:hypothetical protein [Rugamonas sp.]|uniref:hypothetical protein n=1 Tax=Rugamonas sp. TaxID=1926287 RepID=UPI0025D4CE46|nr:hypothetical protein [Rugamonas sp.]
MDRQRTLLVLGQKMSAAIAADDWKMLTAINTLMASTLPAMAEQGRWTPAERAALTALRQLHEQATARCEQSADVLDTHLHAMRANKEGWLAYAFDNAYTDLRT